MTLSAVQKRYGDCEGPLGFPMRSATAHLVEELLAGHEVTLDGEKVTVPEECRVLRRAMKVAAAMSFAEGERADISFITTDSVDRDKEVMYPRGANWSQFRKNPIVTFAHDYRSLPVGRSLWLKREERNGREGWLAKTRYSTRPDEWTGPWFPDAVWHLVHEGDLPGKSIGFIALESRKPTEAEVRARPDLAGVSYVIPKWLALEYAVAPVPANPDALVTTVAKAETAGVTIPDELLDALGLVIPRGAPSLEAHDKGTFEAVKAPLTASAVRGQVLTAVRELDLGTVVRDEVERQLGRV